MIKCLQRGFAKLLLVLVFTAAIGGFCVVLAQPNFTTVCEKKIGKNDYLQVQFKVENAANVEAIDPPSFKDFSIVSGPSQESGMTSINGKVDQYVAISYYLKPNATGNFTIGPATAKADGKEFHTSPVTVEVTNSSAASSSSPANSMKSLSPFGNMNFDFSPEPTVHKFDDYILKKGENVNEKVQKNLFVKLDVSKTNCFVGEPIIASYKLYTRLRSETNITSAPSFNGFSVSELELNNNNSAGIEKYNGREYNVYILRKVQLYPLQAGTVTLDPIVADNKVTFLKSEYAGSQRGDLFYDMLQNFADATSPQDAVIQQHVTLQSKAVEIKVKPLPEVNKPLDFKGAVGSFTMQATLQKNNITTDDAGNLKIGIAGAGNIQLINAPRVIWPDGMDGYEAKINDDINKLSVPMRGTKTFTFPFTVSGAGSYTIPPASFSYFDPVSSAYKTLHTEPLVINVTKGTGNSNNPYLKNKIIETPNEANIVTRYGLYFLIGIVLIAGIIFWLYARNNSKKNSELLNKAVENQDTEKAVIGPKQQFVIPANPLYEAHEKLMEENSGAFYAVLDASFKKYLSAKFNVPTEELTKKRLNEELDKRNVGLGTSLLLSSLMEDVELNVYAPPSNINHLKEVYEKASEVVSLLDKQVS
ncbi:MAG: BatD family protein [Ginsengibacter sp.]